LQSLVLTPVSRRVDVRQATGRKNTESLSHHDEKHVVPTPFNEIRIGKRRKLKINNLNTNFQTPDPKFISMLTYI
jgi:hypothetical protein